MRRLRGRTELLRAFFTRLDDLLVALPPQHGAHRPERLDLDAVVGAAAALRQRIGDVRFRTSEDTAIHDVHGDVVASPCATGRADRGQQRLGGADQPTPPPTRGDAVPPVQITETLHVSERAEWRRWLADNHATKREIWLVSFKAATCRPRIAYIDSVKEAICFGWIDGIAKTFDPERTAQRFTPRRPNSNWTELNKDRARRLIAEGLMTDAGHATLPDLSPEAFTIEPDILAALQADPQTWAHFQTFPPLYQRVRVSLVEEQRRNTAEFKRRLEKLLDRTSRNELYGRWQD